MASYDVVLFAQGIELLYVEWYCRSYLRSAPPLSPTSPPPPPKKNTTMPHKTSLLPLSLPPSLPHTEVVDIAFGSGPHLLALTSRGELYSWGHNGYGQLGLGIGITSSAGAFPQKVVGGGLGGVRVTKVACGGHHTLVLSDSGEVSVCVCVWVPTPMLREVVSPPAIEFAFLHFVCVYVSATYMVLFYY